MRLIDAEAWKLDLLLFHGCNEKTAWIFDRINHAPTVDAVPVIRCKDCKYCSIDNYADGNVPIYECTFWDNGTSVNGYCHEAQRKEE